MNNNENAKMLLEKQYQELEETAKKFYPGIETAISTLNNMTAQTTHLQDYLNLSIQTPAEISNNHVAFI